MLNDLTQQLLARYLKQQTELGIDSLVVSSTAMLHTEEVPAKLPTHFPSRSDVSAPTPAPQQPPTIQAHTYEEKRAALKALYLSLQQCQKCDLSRIRRKMVFGAGNAAATVMVIGEAPGEDEDNQGMPFVGLAGQLLTKMLGAIKLDRQKDTFITNILKCRPPGNRNPEDSEILACRPIVEKQIEIIAPKAILLLGRIAAHELLKTKESIAQLRTRLHTYNEIPAVVTYHPAALLRNQQYKKPAWEDLQKLQKILNDMGVYENGTE